MSLPEASTLTPATNGIIPPISEQEASGSNAPVVPVNQRLDLATTELHKIRMELDKTRIQLVHTRIFLQSETQGRQTLQQGLNLHQQLNIQLAERYGSVLEDCAREITSLREDLQIDAELIASQKQLIGFYQSQQQQQHASNVVQVGPPLSQYNDHNHLCHNCSPYQSSGNDGFMDPASLRSGNNFDFGLFHGEPSHNPEPVTPPPASEFQSRAQSLPMPSVLHPVHDLSYNTEQVITPPVDNFENREQNLSIQAGLHPISAERDAPFPAHYETEEAKMVPGEEGGRPNKKRKTTHGRG